MNKEKKACVCNDCGRDLYDGTYCIFHSKDEGKKEEFKVAFWEEHRRMGRSFYGYQCANFFSLLVLISKVPISSLPISGELFSEVPFSGKC